MHLHAKSKESHKAVYSNGARSPKGWFSLAHKHNITITSENTRDISASISINIRRTKPLICLMLFSLAHKDKHKKNEHVFFSAHAYAYAQLRTA